MKRDAKPDFPMFGTVQPRMARIDMDFPLVCRAGMVKDLPAAIAVKVLHKRREGLRPFPPYNHFPRNRSAAIGSQSRLYIVALAL
jgi:hypothetical protein